MSNNNPNIAVAPTPGAGRTPSVGANVQAALFPPSPGRTSNTARAKGPTVTPLKVELIAWRPLVIYVGTLSADTEIGVGSTPEDGALLRKLSMRVRSDFALSSTDYWRIEARWRDESLNAMALATISTDTRSFHAHREYPIYHVGAGLRMIQQHEVSVAFTKVGSPGTLAQVTLYADWYVGL